VSDYDTDTVLWSERQADLLRRVAAGERINDQVDWENVADEIDSVGRSQRLALASYVGLVLEHLMKLEASPAREPRRGWKETVRRTRLDIKRLLEANPSLRRSVDAVKYGTKSTPPLPAGRRATTPQGFPRVRTDTRG